MKQFKYNYCQILTESIYLLGSVFVPKQVLIDKRFLDNGLKLKKSLNTGFKLQSGCISETFVGTHFSRFLY